MRYNAVIVCRNERHIREVQDRNGKQPYTGYVSAKSLASMLGARAPVVIVAEGVFPREELEGVPVERLVKNMSLAYGDGAVEIWM